VVSTIVTSVTSTSANAPLAATATPVKTSCRHRRAFVAWSVSAGWLSQHVARGLRLCPLRGLPNLVREASAFFRAAVTRSGASGVVEATNDVVPPEARQHPARLGEDDANTSLI
jgi:hypothetical protein